MKSTKWASLVAQTVKNLPASAGDPGFVTGRGRSPGEGNSNLLQYSCLENSMDRGPWRATTSRGHKETDMTGQTTLTLQNSPIWFLKVSVSGYSPLLILT